MDLVLASTSPWRRDMLRQVGLDPRCVAPGVVEVHEGGTPREVARRLAEEKARAVAAQEPNAWVLGADQVVFLGDRLFHKPASSADHLEALRALRGRWHELVTAWTLLGPGPDARGESLTRLKLRDDLSDAELEAYVATGEARGCAGGYAVEGLGGALFEAIEGDYFNVLGLPLHPVLGALRERGWRFGHG